MTEQASLHSPAGDRFEGSPCGNDLSEQEGGEGLFGGSHLCSPFLGYPQKRGQRRTKAAAMRSPFNAPTRERSEGAGWGLKGEPTRP